MQRQTIDTSNLQLPISPLPKPGDRIFWYSDATPFEGTGPAESENWSMYTNSLFRNREIPGAAGCNLQPVRSGKAKGRTPDMYAPGKSDGGILSMKRTNKGVQSRHRHDQPPAESVEKRPAAEGNRVQTTVTGTQGLESASNGLNRVCVRKRYIEFYTIGTKRFRRSLGF